MRVERLKHACDQPTQTALVAQINQLHLCAAAPFQLSDEVLKDILCKKNGSPNLGEEIAILAKAQNWVMNSLQAYWWPEFSVCASQQSLCNQDGVPDYHDQDRDKPGSLPPVITDRGEEGYKSRAMKLPPLARPPVADTPLHHSAANTLPKLLISPSTQRLFPAANSPPHPILPESTDMQKRVHLRQQLSYLQASLRCNLLAGAPLNHFFKSSKCQQSEDTTTNLLLFWNSVENLLMKDEMRRLHNRCHGVGTISKHSCLFDGPPLANNLKSLLELHFQQTSLFPIQLPAPMKEQLQILLPKGLGQSILLSAQEYASKVGRPNTDNNYYSSKY